MNTSELLAKRANLQRIKDFARQLKDFNKSTLDPSKPRYLEGRRARQVEIARKFQESKVARAAEFAKHVPKPRKVVNEVVQVGSLRSNPVVPSRTVSVSHDKTQAMSTHQGSAVYRDKYLVHGAQQSVTCAGSRSSGMRGDEDDDDGSSEFESDLVDSRFEERKDKSTSLSTKLDQLENKYIESRRQVESIKNSYRMP